MPRRLSVLDHVRVASPCPASWAAMTGDERVRHCASCNLNVFNLSEMTREEAEALILSKQGRLCIRYYQRADGTILTRDCPVGLARLRRRLAAIVSGVAAACVFLASGLTALARGSQGSGDLRLKYFKPFDRVVAWLTPPPTSVMMGIRISLPPNHAAILSDPEMAQPWHDAFGDDWDSELRRRSPNQE